MRVLIVDDNAAFITSLSDICELLGIRVTGARTGPEAIARLEESEFQAALIDLYLPGINGLEIYQRIAARHPALRVSFVTGYAQSSLAAKAAMIGIPVITKPVSFDQILRFIEFETRDEPQMNAGERRSELREIRDGQPTTPVTVPEFPSIGVNRRGSAVSAS